MSRLITQFSIDYLQLFKSKLFVDDATANQTQSGKYAASTAVADLWGKVIPYTYGKRRITGQPLQLGRSEQVSTFDYTVFGTVQTKAIVLPTSVTTFRKSTFAYVFGAPGNAASNQILTKLWINDVKIYDATTGDINRNFKFKFFAGTETQEPDVVLNEFRYDYPIAYKGLMYVVFYDYVPPNSPAPGDPFKPTVEAEFAEQISNTAITIVFEDQAGNPLINTFDNYAGFNAKRGRLYNNDDADNIVTVDVATGVQVNSATVSGYDDVVGPMSINSRAKTYFVEAGVPYCLSSGYITNAQRLYLINCDSGVIVDGIGSNNNSLTPDETTFPAPNYITAERIGSVHQIAIVGGFGSFQIIQAFGGELTYIATGPTLTGSVGYAFYYDGEWKYTDNEFIYNFDGTVLYTGTYEIQAVLKTSVFDDVIICESAGSNWRIYRTPLDGGPIKWEYNNVNRPDVDFSPTNAHIWRTQSNTQGQAIGWFNGSTRFVLNFLSGTIDVITGGDVPGVGFPIYDDYLRTIINFRNAMSSQPIYNGTSGDITLESFIRNLAERAGYDPADITVTGINDTIVGAAITEISDISSLLNDIAIAYNFEIVKRGRKILFTRRVLGGAFAADGEITENDRAILAEQDEAFVTLRSERVNPTQVPGKVVIRFIDPELQYIVNQVEYIRNDDQANLSQALELNLPIIMSASAATTLAARTVVAAVEARIQHEFLLPQKFMAIETGDYFELVTDAYTDVIKITDVSYNADYSLLCEAEAVSTQIATVIDLEPYPVFDDQPRVNDELGIIAFDTPLLVHTDQQIGDRLEAYFSLVPAGRSPVGSGQVARSYSGNDFQTVGATSEELLFGFVAEDVTTVNSGVPWQYNELASIAVRISQGDTALLVDVTVLEMLAGANRLLIGIENRWEFIGYTTVVYNAATNLAVFSGLVRGLRGTEINIANHERSDYVIVYSATTVAIDVGVTSDKLNTNVYYVGVNGAGYYTLEDGLVTLADGNARKPWAVSNVRIEVSGGDLDVSWTRRTRLLGPLVDGSPDVPLDEATEAYEIDIYRLGAIVRVVTGVSSEGFTYTAAQQTADGFSGSLSSLQLDIYQISAVVGRGFVKAGTYDVE